METKDGIEIGKLAVELIGKVVWPLVLGFFLWCYRNQLFALIDRIKSAKFLNAEIQLEAAKEEAKERLVQDTIPVLVSEQDESKREEIATETLTLRDIVDQLDYLDLDFLRNRANRATDPTIIFNTSRTDQMRIAKLARLGLLEKAQLGIVSVADTPIWNVTDKALKLLDAIYDSPTTRMIGKIHLKDS